MLLENSREDLSKASMLGEKLKRRSESVAARMVFESCRADLSAKHHLRAQVHRTLLPPKPIALPNTAKCTYDIPAAGINKYMHSSRAWKHTYVATHTYIALLHTNMHTYTHTLNYSTLHYGTLHYITLRRHYITLYYIALSTLHALYTLKKYIQTERTYIRTCMKLL